MINELKDRADRLLAYIADPHEDVEALCIRISDLIKDQQARIEHLEATQLLDKAGLKKKNARIEELNNEVERWHSECKKYSTLYSTALESKEMQKIEAAETRIKELELMVQNKIIEAYTNTPKFEEFCKQNTQKIAKEAEIIGKLKAREKVLVETFSNITQELEALAYVPHDIVLIAKEALANINISKE